MQSTFQIRLDQLEKKLQVDSTKKDKTSNLELMKDLADSVDPQSFEEIASELQELDERADEISEQLSIKDKVEKYQREYLDFHRRLLEYARKA